MRRQNFFQHVGLVVEGKSDSPNKSLRLELFEELETAETFVHCVMLGVQRVQQVVIEIFHTASFQLGGKNSFVIARRFNGPRHFIRKQEGFAGIAFDDQLANDVLRLSLAISRVRVEVAEVAFHVFVDHFLNRLHIVAAVFKQG